MVAAVILVLTAQGFLRGPYVGDMHVIAGLIILVREIAVSGLREFLGGLQVSVPVATREVEDHLPAGRAGLADPRRRVAECRRSSEWIHVPHTVGLITLWGAAMLTLVTGWDYLRVGLKHMD